jgi:hypothetical protein
LEDTQNVAQFCLYDLSGKLIAEQDFKQEITVSTYQFPAGLYFLEVKSNDLEYNLKLTIE